MVDTETFNSYLVAISETSVIPFFENGNRLIVYSSTQNSVLASKFTKEISESSFLLTGTPYTVIKTDSSTKNSLHQK